MSDLTVVIFLMLAAFAAGWVDAIGGGGGLIQFPALLFGLPNATPAQLLGTNKASIPMAIIAFIGSLVGAIFSTNLPRSAFEPIVLVVLVVVGSWILFSPNVQSQKINSKIKSNMVMVFGGMALGFYDGAFGPGTGAFLIALFVGALGKQYLAASAGAKVVNLATNLGAVIVFSITGSIIWTLALIMAVANFAGGIFGAKTAIGKGSKFVKIIVATVAFASALRLAFQIWG
jgi:uncharacterized membrane protein YfcA